MIIAYINHHRGIVFPKERRDCCLELECCLAAFAHRVWCLYCVGVEKSCFVA